ncbi:hypothetical protein [Pseudomonas sp. MWU13-2105]|uniref:hypothetical protein n=1 Tax=Pseudomonas sp. MWU13-2105 TaxID=2935074 RepID=UPI0020109263|nr:hypothetical protein [Pseudomonas sp. MWU13-2105]
MTFNDLIGKYLFLPMLDTFEWPDEMWPYFQVLAGHDFVGEITCFYSEPSHTGKVIGSFYPEEGDREGEGHLRVILDGLASDLQCDVEGSFCALYKAASQEAMRRMWQATYYKLVSNSAGDYNLWLMRSEADAAILQFSVADESRRARLANLKTC